MSERQPPDDLWHPIDIEPPENFELEIAVRQAARDDERHNALRRIVSVPTEAYLWVPEDAITFTPPLSDVIYGDGRALLSLTTTFDRPAFWLIRIDSRWDVGQPSYPSEDAPDIREYTDYMMSNLVAEFGEGEPGWYDHQEEGEREPYPAIWSGDGYSWRWHGWPAEAGPVEPHPYWRHTTIAAAQ
ncbi:MAG: hypothetical protein OXU74_06655 [Gemmatimonadota bacterium]|nr:hypothetical protein [Gemmatimonadota bacterium]